VVIGGAMTAFWMNVLWSMSTQLYWEKEQGNLAPVHHGSELNDVPSCLHGIGRDGCHDPAGCGDRPARFVDVPVCNMWWSAHSKCSPFL